MHIYFVQRAVRRWLMLGAAALVLRAIAFLPVLAPWSLGIILFGSGAATAATIGLAVLLGRHLRARGQLAVWEIPGMGLMLAILFLTNPLMAPTAHPPIWLMALAWVACTAGIMMGVLGLMAYQDTRRAEQRVRTLVAASPEED
ncbi:MAG: hypothetical protein H0X24_14580 [Ktedonobacterales bacterium]|nr:hypothetical protein [Ktedonobacterales bacterium]